MTRIFRYLKNTKSDGITSRLDVDEFSPNTLWGFVDSDWAGCPDTCRSTSGYFFTFKGAVLSWKSKRQSSVAFSTAEVEYVAGSLMVQENPYLFILVNSLIFPQPGLTPVFADNKTSIA